MMTDSAINNVASAINGATIMIMILCFQACEAKHYLEDIEIELNQSNSINKKCSKR